MTTEELGLESIKHSEQLKTVFKQLEILNGKMDAIEELALSVQKLALSVEQIANAQSEDRQQQKEITYKLIELERYPSNEKAHKYEKLSDKILTVLIGAFLGYLLKSLLGI